MPFTNLQRSLLYILLLAILALSQPHGPEDHPNHNHHHIPSQTDLQNHEHSLEQEFKQQKEQELNPWVVDEFHMNSEYPEVQTYEAIIFYLEPNVTQLYRLPVSLQQTMKIEVSVYQVGPVGQITVPQNPDQDQYVELISSEKTHPKQFHEGKIYLTKIFLLHFTETHKILKFRNNKNEAVAVMVSMEQQEMMMQLAVSDDKFELTNKKMQALLKEAKQTEVNREHMYKWQWGFYQKHQRHLVDMLGFTGAELFAIIGTSIVQMYCIKSLIDNELII